MDSKDISGVKQQYLYVVWMGMRVSKRQMLRLMLSFAVVSHTAILQAGEREGWEWRLHPNFGSLSLEVPVRHPGRNI